jgi:hypothetical protein
MVASSEEIPTVAAPGTLDWIFAEYRADRRFTKLDARTKRNHEVGFRLVGGHILRDGRMLGKVRLAAIDTAVVDALYEKLLVVRETDTDGKTIERERRTTINHAMKSCRRAWNVASRRNPGKVPAVNPFARMGLHRTGDADGDARGASRLPSQGDRNGLLLAGNRRADRLGMASA